MRVEAGLNRLLLPCPARLRPADNRQHPLHPTGKLGRTRLAALWARWPCARLGSKARDAQVRGRNARSGPGIAELMRRAEAAPTVPASQTGRSHFFFRGRGPAAGCRFASPGGRRGDVPWNESERILMRSPNPRQCRGSSTSSAKRFPWPDQLDPFLRPLWAGQSHSDTRTCRGRFWHAETRRRGVFVNSMQSVHLTSDLWLPEVDSVPSASPRLRVQKPSCWPARSSNAIALPQGAGECIVPFATYVHPSGGHCGNKIHR